MPKVPDGFKCEIVLEAPDIHAPTALCVAPNGDVYFGEDTMDMGGPPTKNIDRIWLLKGGDPHKKILFADHMWAVMGLELVGNKLYCVNAPHVTVFTLDADGKATDKKDLFTDLGPPMAGIPSFNDHIPSGIHYGADGWLYVSNGDKGIPKMTRKEANEGSVYVTEGRERRHQRRSVHQSRRRRRHPFPPRRIAFGSLLQRHAQPPRRSDGRPRPHLCARQYRRRPGLVGAIDVPAAGRLPGLSVGVYAAAERNAADHPRLRRRRPVPGLRLSRRRLAADVSRPHLPLRMGPRQSLGRQGRSGRRRLQIRRSNCLHGPGEQGEGFPAVLDPADRRRPRLLRHRLGLQRLAAEQESRPHLQGHLRQGRREAGAARSDKDSIADLIKALDHPAFTERLRAQRALQAKGKEAADAVAVKYKKGELSKRALERAVWVMDKAWPDTWKTVVLGATRDADAGVRLEAVRVIGNHPPVVKSNEIGGLLSETTIQSRLFHLAAEDPDPQVRMQSAAVLSKCGDVAVFLLPLLAKEKDHYVRFAIVRAIKRTVHWDELRKSDAVEELEAQPKFDAAFDGLFWALADEYDLGAVTFLKSLAAHKDPAVRQKAVADLVRIYRDRKPYAGGWWGTQPAAHGPPPRDVDWEGTPAVREAVLAALADKDANVRKEASRGLLAVKDPATLEPLEKQFVSEKDLNTRADLLRAVAGLDSPKAAGFLTSVVKDGKEAAPLRIEAVAGLEKIKTPASAETLAGLVASSEPEPLQVGALTGLSVLKMPAGKAAAVKALKSPAPAVRAAAATAVAAVAGADAVKLLTPLLTDKDSAVRIAAVQGLGSLKNKAAVPALLRAAGAETTQFDAVSALAKTPDARALSAYLIGLGSKNVELRKACRAALAAVRDEAAPALEQLVKGNEVKASLLPELRLHLLFPSAHPAMAVDWAVSAKRQASAAGEGTELRRRLQELR